MKPMVREGRTRRSEVLLLLMLLLMLLLLLLLLLSSTTLLTTPSLANPSIVTMSTPNNPSSPSTPTSAAAVCTLHARASLCITCNQKNEKLNATRHKPKTSNHNTNLHEMRLKIRIILHEKGGAVELDRQLQRARV